MSEVYMLQQQRVQMEKLMEKRNLALRLQNIPEFRKLILEDFCVEECARYVQASADPALNAEQRADSLAIAQAAGHLRRFLNVVVQMGNSAENQLPSIDDAIIEAEAEEQQ